MNMKHCLPLILIPLLASCSTLSTEGRDAAHEQSVSAYRQALLKPAGFDKSCTLQGKLGAWVEFDITAGTPVVLMPSGTAAASVCVAIPEGATEATLLSDPGGGLTYYSSTLAFPSAQFLDVTHQVVRDYPEPKVRVGQGLTNNFGLTEEYDLTKVLMPSRYILIYVHPDSLENGVEVVDRLQKIRVPYGPYGHFRLMFKKK